MLARLFAGGSSSVLGRCSIGARAFSEDLSRLHLANSKDLLKHKVKTSIVKYQRHKSDTGSPQSQIAALTEKINSLTAHFAKHKKDNASKRGYQAMITTRRRMLIYLKERNVVEYNALVKSFGWTVTPKKVGRG